MKPFGKAFAAAAILFAGVAAFAPVPDASDAHFAIINNSDFYFPSYGYNFGTVMKLAGPKSNPSLNIAASLATGTMSQDSGNGTPEVQVVKHGSDVCVFLTDGADSNGANEISSFRYPNQTPVGTYTDTNVPNSYLTWWLATSGDYVFVGFNKYVSSWGIGPGCTLTHLQTTQTMRGYSDAVVTPNGKAIVAYEDAYLDSFTIGPNGTLTEMGPYFGVGGQGMDVTADSQYVIFGGASCGGVHDTCYNAVITLQINSDGTLNLGSEQVFGGDGSLGTSDGLGYVRLSPDERFLYATSLSSNLKINQIVTLGFTENPLNFTYHRGCTTNVKITPYQSYLFALATAQASGSGGALYVADNQGVTLLGINPTTGCSREAPGSPFSVNDSHAAITSVVAWPPRGF